MTAPEPSLVFWPRSRRFWLYQGAAVAFVVGVSLLSSALRGVMDARDTLSTLAWAPPYTLAVLGFRAWYERHGASHRRMVTLVPVVIVYSTLAGVAVTAVVAALVLPWFWDAWMARQADGVSAGMALWRYLLGYSLQTQVFIAAWAFVYVGVRQQQRAGEVELLNLRLSNRLREAQLSQLANQLQPHFLFNAINNIRFLVHESPARADATLLALSDMLRLSLESSQAEKIPLAREMEAVQAYLAIQRVQLEDRLRIDLQVPEGLGACAVPPMLLQMLVENAVKHGLEPRVGGGTLRLRVTALEGQLGIEVHNDCLPADASPPGLGIGLDNIARRLQLLYGDAAHLAVERPPGAFCVRIRLPREAGPC